MADGVKNKLLVVSDSRLLQQAIAVGAAKWCDAVFCEDPSAIPTLLTNNPTITAAMVEQPMAKGGGITVLEYLQKYRPAIRRILLATPNDLSAAVGALHRGSAQHVAYAPVSPADLEMMLAPTQRPAARPSGAAPAPLMAPQTQPHYQHPAAANQSQR